mgnify:CR=1 FL=1
MKTLKKIFSMLLCAALLLSSAPILNFSLFRTDAAAVSYAKTHTKEYYYATGTQFVSYLATGGDRDGNTAKAKVTDSGYTLIDKNLNAGVRVSSGLLSTRAADEVYLGYKTSSDPTVSIRDLRIMVNKSDDRYTCPENGAAYTLVGLTPISQVDNDGGGSVDLNQSKSSADYLHYFATKDNRVGAPIVSITINNNGSQSGYETVKYLNSGDFNNAADANRDASGEYIFTHLTRLPEVDTTGLRSAMETADTYIANGQLYVDISALTKARDNAKNIIADYDNYAAGYEAFSTAYNQAAIDNAKTAIENAIKALLTKLDWTAFNAAVSKANGLNKNDYVDFSSVENALKNAELVKNSFTTQEQVDSETAKINDAVNALVKKLTTKSFVQGNAQGTDSGWTFQSCVTLEIFNVNSGTDCDYWNSGAGVDRQNGEEYEKTAQWTSDKWNASKATIYVDPDVNSDILSTGVYVSLTMPWVHSEINRARWGVELAAYQNNYTMGVLQNNWRSVTVQSTNGKSLTYSLCDQNGKDKASAQTSNGDFTLDETITDGKKGPYYWYIKGAVPAAGDKVTVRVLGICAAWAHSGNVQKLTEFTDLTIVSVSKTALKKAIYTVVGNESVYTSDSYAAYVTALNEAKDVLNNATAEQTTVDAATAKLNNTINALQAKLDMSALYAARDKANSLNGSDYEDFSEVANLVNMIPNTVFNTQQEVDDYADRLNYAISKLVKKTTSGSLSVRSEQMTVYPGMARNVNNMILYGASIVSDSSFSRYGYEGESDVNCPPTELSFANGHSGQDIHRVYQKASDSAANAYYVFDRYDNNATDISSVNNMIELYMYGEAQSHQHSVALYDGTYNESNFTNFDTGKTTQAVTSPTTGKYYSYNLVGGGLYYNWENTQYLTTHKRYLSLQGPVPDVGDAVQLRIVYRNGTFCFDEKTGLFYYGWVTVNMFTVDSTALRNAIALSKNVLDKSAYSESSYNAYRTALAEATDTLNSSDVLSQDNYDAKTTALVNAINNLERIQTVTLDSQSATTAGTTSVVATIGKAMPAITPPTREHYTFDGYFTQPNGEGVQYYNADGSSARDFDLESEVTLYASWSADKFDIKFVNYDGTVLRNGKVDYGIKPVFDGDEPTRPSDDSCEYTFSGWSPEISEVTADATYTAQFTEKAHRFYCSAIDEIQHEDVCMDCNYKKSAENHHFVYVKISNIRYGYKCKECGYEYSTQLGKNNVEFVCSDYSDAVNKQIVAGCKSSSVYNYEKSINYPIVTIQAPLKITSNGQTLYFVYWRDADTNEVVGTYTTYKYFQTKQTVRFTPVYETQQNYYTTRDQAVVASRVVDCRLNDDGSYSLLAEHSVASSCKSIKGHGVIYTTDSSAIDSLVYGSDNENVMIRSATTSNSALTGLLEVNVKPQGASKIWVRSYVIDANNVVHYGATVVETNGSFTNGVPKSFDVNMNTASADEDIITLGSAGYDLTDVNTESDITFDEEKPTEKSPLEIFKTIIEKLVSIINEIISYFTKAGARI